MHELLLDRLAGKLHMCQSTIAAVPVVLACAYSYLTARKSPMYLLILVSYKHFDYSTIDHNFPKESLHLLEVLYTEGLDKPLVKEFISEVDPEGTGKIVFDK